MSELAKKANPTPESYNPKDKPVILCIAEYYAANNKNIGSSKMRIIVKTYKHEVPALRFIGKNMVNPIL